VPHAADAAVLEAVGTVTAISAVPGSPGGATKWALPAVWPPVSATTAT
jgi:hypothetical protein